MESGLVKHRKNPRPIRDSVVWCGEVNMLLNRDASKIDTASSCRWRQRVLCAVAMSLVDEWVEYPCFDVLSVAPTSSTSGHAALAVRSLLVAF